MFFQHQTSADFLHLLLQHHKSIKCQWGACRDVAKITYFYKEFLEAPKNHTANDFFHVKVGISIFSKCISILLGEISQDTRKYIQLSDPLTEKFIFIYSIGKDMD